jgi:flagellar hook-associated protein 2
MSNTVSLSSLGLGSGLNDASLISSLVTSAQQPLTAMQAQGTAIQTASQTISSFSTQLLNLQSAASLLSDPLQYASYTATSSNSSIVGSASSSATPGTYNVQVTALAQAQVTYSDPQTSSTSALGLSGTLGLTVNGQSASISVGGGDSLATIASNISSAGLGVTASVVFDGSSYRLQVEGQQSGAANAVSFQENGFSLGLSTPANTYQQAQNASATVNNIAITSATNQVTGAIPGVTLALTGVSSTPATVTVASNPSAIATNIQSFVTAYNAVVTAGHAAIGYGTTAASSPLLAGDSGIQQSLGDLANLVISNVPGADSTFQNLGSIGVTLNNDGTLSLNSSQLNAALASDPTGVEKLFVNAPSSGSTGVMGMISTTINNLAVNPGSPLTAEINSFTSETESLTTQESALQARITQHQTQLEAEFTSMETTVQTEKGLFSDLGGTGTFV